MAHPNSTLPRPLADVATIEPEPPDAALLSGQTLLSDAGATVRPATAELVAAETGALPTLDDGSGFRFGPTLGEGGMGWVRSATQVTLGREVAIKGLRPGLNSPDHAASLVREARGTGALQHPNVVPVHALGRDGQGHPLLVMKRITGATWAARLEKGGPATSGDRLREEIEVLFKVCDALAMAHARGVVHRDIKPANVMVGDFGEVYLLDWGLAVSNGGEGLDGFLPRHLAAGLAGTPAYMAPEQASGEHAKLGPQTDVFLLGAVLHEVVTGRPPHAADDARDALAMARRCTPPTYAPEVDPELARLLQRAMSKLPEARFEDAAAFADALRAQQARAGSRAISREAARRLEALRPRAAEPSRAADDLLGVISGCRFAFELALREWADNAEATQGLRACTRLELERAIADRDLRSAERLLTEVGPAAAGSLSAAVGQLRREQELEQHRRAELEEMRLQTDLGTSSSARVGIAWAMVVIWTGIPAAVAIENVRTGWTPPISDYSWAGLGFALFCAVLVAVFRKTLLSNRINRGLSFTLIALGLSVWLIRLLAERRGILPHESQPIERVVYALYTLQLGATLNRQYLGAGVVFAIGALIGLLLPNDPAWVFTSSAITNGAALLVALLSVRAVDGAAAVAAARAPTVNDLDARR